MRIARLESRPIGFRSATLTALLLTATLAAALTLAQPALADVGEKIILRCTHAESLSGFSQSAYRQALKDLEADLEEYSGCSSEIRQAQEAAAAGHGGAGTSAAVPVALAATPAEQRSLAHAQSAVPASVKLKGGAIRPGVVHVDVASALSSMPTPLLATLAFVLVCVAAVAASAVRKRVRAGRSD